jgi:hypothetical protein
MNSSLMFTFRSDAVLRHSRTCSSRGTLPVPTSLKRGKKRKACDYCASSKLSCDFDWPCETCLVNGKDCTYQRVAEDNARQSPIEREQWNKQDGRITPSKINVPQLMQQLNSKVAIPFLLNYTDPQKKAFHETFGRLSTSDPDVAALPSFGEPIQSNPLTSDDEYSLSPLFQYNEIVPIIPFGN